MKKTNRVKKNYVRLDVKIEESIYNEINRKRLKNKSTWPQVFDWLLNFYKEKL